MSQTDRLKRQARAATAILAPNIPNAVLAAVEAALRGPPECPLPRDWPYDQNYAGKCSSCGEIFVGPKLARGCWKCTSPETRAGWTAKHNQQHPRWTPWGDTSEDAGKPWPGVDSGAEGQI